MMSVFLGIPVAAVRLFTSFDSEVGAATVGFFLLPSLFCGFVDTKCFVWLPLLSDSLISSLLHQYRVCVCVSKGAWHEMPASKKRLDEKRKKRSRDERLYWTMEEGAPRWR